MRNKIANPSQYASYDSYLAKLKNSQQALSKFTGELRTSTLIDIVAKEMSLA